MSQSKPATRNVQVGDSDLNGITELVVKFNCSRCGNPSERKITELYCHFPQRHKADMTTATFAVEREYTCMGCLLK